MPPKTPTAAQYAQQVDVLGKALNTAAEDLRQASNQLLQQQADLVAARANNAKMKAALIDLQQRLDDLDGEQFLPTLLYGLSGLLVAALALLGWLGVRKQSAQRRSGLASQPSETLQADDFGAGPKERTDYPEVALSDKAPLVPDAAPVLPGAVVLPALSSAVASITDPDPAPLKSAILAELEPAARVVHPEELFDLQQQAEFFMSVGEHDQAIEVMKKHIAENEKTSPLIYLELLRLYRALSRIADFNHLRVQFHQYFNAEVPEFSGFHGAHRTLFDYPEPLASIEALWCDASVLPLLESYIFCSDEAIAEGRFELQAYEDLLMLYAIASTTPASARGAASLRRRTTPRAGETLQAAALPARGLLDKNQDLDMNLDAHWNMPLPGDPEAMPEPPLDNHLLEFENFVLSGIAPLDAAPPRTPERERSLDIDLTQPDVPDFGQALPEFDFHENSSAPRAPVLPQSEALDDFEALFNFEKRDPGRS
ncbi:MAG: hypothetical protein PHU77_07100 [Simplicispira sp.]|nr:hypothetical protein [Simplicispira sp.]